jgi:SulP family sulfate permease
MRFHLHNLRGDIYGGITAAVVALPLAMAFGVASGLGPIAGLYGAIAVGFFAAVFGGTDPQVSGPTGPMTVVMGAIVAEHAQNLPEAFAIVFLGGLLQIAFGMLRLGRYIAYTPYSVVSGFMTGIGVIIIVIETLPFIGHPTAAGGPVGTLQTWLHLQGGVNTDALLLGLFGLGMVVFWPERLARLLPSPLAALIAGSLLATFVLTDAPIIGEVPTGLPELQLPALSLEGLPRILQPAFILALLGSIDSLLTSLVADSITRDRHDSDRELIGQGIGNMAAGLIGGLPGAGATMRTVVNVRAGGRTPLSGALHALVLLALVLGLGPLAEHIPHAILAAILLKVGWDIIDWGYLKRLKRAPRDKAFVMLVTLLLTVFVDLITAVAVGLILAGFITARWNAEEELKGIAHLASPDDAEDHQLSAAEREALREAQGKVALVRLRGRFSYASARELVRRASTVDSDIAHGAVIYDFTDATRLDTSAALAVEELLLIAEEAGIACVICGLSGEAERTLKDLRVLDKIAPSRVLADRRQAIALACELAGGRPQG